MMLLHKCRFIDSDPIIRIRNILITRDLFLGVVSDKVYLTPQEVALSTKVKEVDVGLQHCIAVSRCGRNVFTWGKAVRGQLGIPVSIEERFSTPQYVGGIEGIIVGVSAGLNHSAAVTSSGAVYLWGKGMSEIENTENKRGEFLMSMFPID
jgi:alpha-tubulin suppressor-like RCC1 family protein